MRKYILCGLKIADGNTEMLQYIPAEDAVLGKRVHLKKHAFSGDTREWIVEDVIKRYETLFPE